VKETDLVFHIGVKETAVSTMTFPPSVLYTLLSATIGIRGVGVVDVVVVVVASCQQASVGKAHTVGSLLACLSAATLLHHDAANITPPVAATRRR
jgi:hypothetical protein